MCSIGLLLCELVKDRRYSTILLEGVLEWTSIRRSNSNSAYITLQEVQYYSSVNGIPNPTREAHIQKTIHWCQQFH